MVPDCKLSSPASSFLNRILTQTQLTTITSLFTWISILIAFLGFRKACDAQGVTRADRPFNSKFQPFTAYAALVFFIIIVVFNGWKVFTHDAITGESNWSIQDFVTA